MSAYTILASQVRTRLRVGGASVDADEASFGHSVVEVEVMCGSAEEVCVCACGVGDRG